MESIEIINHIAALHEKIRTAELAAERTKQVKTPHQSEQVNELVAALAKAQSEMLVAHKSTYNPYYKSKYADFAEVVSASRPSLAKNGLSVQQRLVTDDSSGSLTLHTILAHSSGQWSESTMRVIPSKNDIQTLGSTITYLKRQAYSALVGLATSDEDDDGEAAVATSREVFAKGTAINHNTKNINDSYERITKEQLEDYERELVNYPDIAEMVLNKYKIQSLADIPKSDHHWAITRIRELRYAREGKK